jgi:hypothetical protein
MWQAILRAATTAVSSCSRLEIGRTQAVRWSTTPYKSVKWFVISHDSSYLHLQNLYDSLSTRNASEPQIIGNVQCSPTGVQYPSWRASIVLSRGVFDTIVWDTFYAVERSPLRKSKYSYDVILGQYAKAMGIPVYDHPGFLGASYTSTSSLLAKYADLHKHNARGWTFPFRPISSDQTDDREFFEELHAQLNPIVAKDGEEALIYDPSPCSCKPHTQSRCWPKSEIDVNIWLGHCGVDRRSPVGAKDDFSGWLENGRGWHGLDFVPLRLARWSRFGHWRSVGTGRSILVRCAYVNLRILPAETR